MKRVLALLVLVVAVGSSLPVDARDNDAYQISKKEFFATVKSVAVAPLGVADEFALPADLATFIEEQLIQRLTKEKFAVLGVDQYRDLRDMMAERVGGLVGLDGVVDAELRKVVLDHSKREMRHLHNMDAFVYPIIATVSAPYAKDRAEWDGISQKVDKSGDGFGTFLTGGANYQGTIAAASLQIAVIDRSDKLLFINRGGIEVMQRRVKDKLEVIPLDTLLQDKKKLKKAVQIALKPL